MIAGSPAAQFYPKIDYRTHPAFRALGVAQRSDDDEVNRLISEIDDELSDLQERHHVNDAELESNFSARMRPKLDNLADYLARTTEDVRVKSWLQRAMADATAQLHEYLRIRNYRHATTAVQNPTPIGEAVGADLERDGVHICRLDAATHERLLQICAPYMEDMRAEAKSRPRKRIVRNFELHTKVGRILGKFFQRQGIIEGLRRYVGSNVNFAGFSFEYSYAGQTWWTGVYSDLGNADAKTTYMHYDQGCSDPKAIIALSQVGEDNGPTGFVRGSHKQPRSTFLHFMITALDRRFQRDAQDADENANYRPRFSNSRYRKELLALPTSLQGSSHFGDDILDGSPLSEELLKNEVRMTSDVGNCIVFDGNYGIHRGALVKSGERFVFQVIFDIAQPLPLSTIVKRRLRGLALEAIGSLRR